MEWKCYKEWRQIVFKIKSFLIALIIVFSQIALCDSRLHIKKEVAIEIAEEKLVKMYGKKVLGQRPFVANLEEDIWKIEGTFHCPKGSVCKGGVAKIDISAKDGTVLHVEHGK